MTGDCQRSDILDKVRATLNLQEAKVILLMREYPYQTITIVIENGKVVNKKQTKSFED